MEYKQSEVDKINYLQVGLNFSLAHRQDLFNILAFGTLKMFDFSGRKAHLIIFVLRVKAFERSSLSQNLFSFTKAAYNFET